MKSHQSTRKVLRSVVGLRSKDLTPWMVDFIQPFGPDAFFAISIGFCLDRTPGMAFAKTLDPDKNAIRQNDSI